MIYEHKRGATLDLSGQITPVGSAQVPDVTNWVGTAQIRTLADAAISTLTVSWLDVANRIIRIQCDESITATWPLGIAELDIRFTAGNDVLFTTTQQLMIVKEITRA